MPGTELKCTYKNSDSSYCVSLEIVDKQMNKIEYKCTNKNEFTFTCPSSDVTISATSHHIKEFHEQLTQTFHNAGYRLKKDEQIKLL